MRSLLAGVVVVVLLPLASAAERNKDPLVEKVSKAIDQAKRFLMTRAEGGHWDSDIADKSYPGGRTSLALLALLNAGVKPGDDVIQKGLQYLRTINPNRTYVVGLQTMVFGRPARKWTASSSSATSTGWWRHARIQAGATVRAKEQHGDNSNTQYALLGLHEGMQVKGIKIDPAVLQSIQDFYIRTQVKDGQGAPAGAITWGSGRP